MATVCTGVSVRFSRSTSRHHAVCVFMVRLKVKWDWHLNLRRNVCFIRSMFNRTANIANLFRIEQFKLETFWEYLTSQWWTQPRLGLSREVNREGESNMTLERPHLMQIDAVDYINVWGLTAVAMSAAEPLSPSCGCLRRRQKYK